MTIVFIRSFILYLIVIFSVRLMGKRQLGELQPAELVITILISNIATLSLENINIPLLHGILPILALVCYEVLVSWISLKSVKIRRMISGSPKIIIRDGILDQNMLKNLRFSVDDLMIALRMSGIFFIEDVQFAIVETNGSVSVYQKSSEQPATKEDVHTAKKNFNPPQVIIADGQLREHALYSIGQDKKWLDMILRTADASIPEIFMMTADNACRYHIIKKG
ncbi:MAG: DUF421 domain-containing protein [Oscillospiraceae bacterium]|nr:DUF421 domain-containing protein [Oscillospiraceae bacterium]